MPLYRWSAGSIAQLESISPAPGKLEAVLRPRADADPKLLGELHNTLGSHGIINFIGCEKGADTLIIPDVKDEKNY